MRIRITAIAAAAMLCASAQADKHYAGGDISLLTDYEKAGAAYKDHEGKPIADVLPWLHQEGMNAMRVRLFVNPSKYRELHASDPDPDLKYDPNACQDIDYIIPLCKRIKDTGMALMLDFHYSDTWADPQKQWTPIDWEDLTDEELYQKIYDYTATSLRRLKEAGVTPDFIQPGNEISYGMLWGKPGDSNPKKVYTNSPANWDRFGTLLRQAIKACREECPYAGIIIHTERVAQPGVLTGFYNRMRDLGIDYDIIGLSYYPYWHGGLPVLSTALSGLQSAFPEKHIMLVETGYPYKWEVPGSTHDMSGKWPYTDAGQNAFAHDLVDTLLRYSNVDGLFWWWLEYNAYGTSLSGWYNAPLFDSTTGRATSALETICSFATGSSGAHIPVADTGETGNIWHNMQGMPVDKPSAPGIYILGRGAAARKVLVR